MTHEEWAEAERLAAQAAAIAHEHAVVAQVETTATPAPAGGDPLLAWLDAAPIGDLGTEAALASALRAVLTFHVPRTEPVDHEDFDEYTFCDSCYGQWPCDTYEGIAEALEVTL